MARPRKGDGLLSERVVFRLRSEEIAGLKWAAAQAQMHPADLIRALLRAALTAGPAYFDDEIEQMQALIRGFNKYGGRLNRLVKAANRGHAPDEAELRALLNTLGLLVHSAEAYYRAEVRKTVKKVPGRCGGRAVRLGRACRPARSRPPAIPLCGRPGRPSRLSPAHPRPNQPCGVVRAAVGRFRAKWGQIGRAGGIRPP